MNTHTESCMYAYIHPSIHHTYMHIYIHIYQYACNYNMYAYVDIVLCVYFSLYTHGLIIIFTYIHIYIHMYIYTHVYVHVYVYVSTHIKNTPQNYFPLKGAGRPLSTKTWLFSGSTLTYWGFIWATTISARESKNTALNKDNGPKIFTNGNTHQKT